MNDKIAEVSEPLSPVGEAKLRAALDRLFAKSGYLTGCEQMNARLLATLDATRAASRTTLDVDRLAEALDVGEWPPSEYPAGYRDPRWITELARRVAAEYARLSGDAVMEERT